MDAVLRHEKRKSLPMSRRDIEDLARLRASAAHRDALLHLVGSEVTDGTSEAALLHAVFEAGMRAVSERVELEGYAELAEQTDAAARRASARRRPPLWADE